MRHSQLNRRSAYTLVEILISLAITATLLAAMGVAFTTAASAMQMNDRYFRSVQQARTGIDLIMTLVRRCQAITAPTPGAAGTTATTTIIKLTPASGDFGGDNLTIGYYPSITETNGTYTNVIMLTDNTTGTFSVLAGPAHPGALLPGDSQVTSAQFSVLSGNNLSGVSSIAGISLTMTVEIPNNQITLSNSAAPRVNLVSLYQ